MKDGIYPIFKSGLPDLELHADRYTFPSPDTAVWFRVGTEPLELGTDVSRLKASSTYIPTKHIILPSLNYIYPISAGTPEDAEKYKTRSEEPLVFAGRLAVDDVIYGAAGVLYRSGHQLGWMNIRPLYS